MNPGILYYMHFTLFSYLLILFSCHSVLLFALALAPCIENRSVKHFTQSPPGPGSPWGGATAVAAAAQPGAPPQPVGRYGDPHSP